MDNLFTLIALNCALRNGDAHLKNFGIWPAGSLPFSPRFQDGVVVLGVALDKENAATLVTSFLKVHPMKYRVALGSEKAGERFKIEQMPTTVGFDRNWK